MRCLALFFSICTVALGAHAEVVRCTDAGGAVSYTNVACPPNSKRAAQVQILESPPPDAAAPQVPQALQAPRAPRPPSTPTGPVAANPPSGPAVIPRFPSDIQQQQPAADPPVYILGPDDPYYDGARPIRRPPHHVRDPGPPPGQRPCNLAGIKRNNC